MNHDDPFDEAIPLQPPADASTTEEGIGSVIRGSLSKGLEVKLTGDVPLESLRAGIFVVAEGERYDYLSLITDLELTETQPGPVQGPTPPRGSLLHEALAGETLYARVNLRPSLMLSREADRTPTPVKTIPPHFTKVRRASGRDVKEVFGHDRPDNHHFHLGSPLEMDDIALAIDLKALAERSFAVFGKSGTGKTFFTRLLLAGLIRNRAAVNLIFDMHGEYGWHGTDEAAAARKTESLKALFGTDVQIFCVDPDVTDADYRFQIPHSALEPEDILSLQQVLRLTPTAAENVYLLQRIAGKDAHWFDYALAMDTKEVSETEEAHAGALAALKRKLAYLKARCRHILAPSAPDDAVGEIVRNLMQGRHTVVSFGKYTLLEHYLLVANLLTRRIEEAWRRLTDDYLQDSRKNPEPPPLVITIEEAHKFLDPAVAGYTTFGRLAREMRKYRVTLLVVDQRPSQIEREVLSQIGTRFCFQMDDERDVDAALTGVSGSTGLRQVLAGLDSREQVLGFGHALPMPLVLKPRKWDEEARRGLRGPSKDERRQRAIAEGDLY